MQLLQPKLRIKRLGDLCIADLKQRGLKAIGLDKDNVLTLPNASLVDPLAREQVERLKQHFYVAVFSNSVGSSRDYKPRQQRFVGSIPVVEHGTRKPWGGRLLLEHFRAEANCKLEAFEVAFAGDRVLTDVLFANINSFYSILVDPLDPGRDARAVQMIRRMEKCF